jgi:hypothetical protein
MGVTTASYTGSEASVPFGGQSPEPSCVFVVYPPHVPAGAAPIYDEETDAVIGYRFGSVGVYRIYDFEGNLVEMSEEGLEPPLLDPIDLLFIVGGAVRLVGKAGSRLLSKFSTIGVRAAATSLSSVARTALRASLRRVSVGSLKFTATTAARMGTQGRHVPLQILHLAIKYGKRAPDPQKIAGAFEYTIPMLRNGRQYILKVVLRESDRTILHFHYF